MMIIQMLKNQIESLEQSIKSRETVIAQQKADIDRLHNLLAEECGARKRAEEALLEAKALVDIHLVDNFIESKADDGFDKPGKEFKYI